MFDLENAIKQWRKKMAADPGLDPGQVAELEAGLRDEIDGQVRQGLSVEAAFARVVAEFGPVTAIGAEFDKVYAKRDRSFEREKSRRICPALFWSMVKTAGRRWRRHRGHTVIQTAGLALGLLCFLLIMVWVRRELSYDNYHERGARVYRLLYANPEGGRSWAISYALPPAVRAEVPEVEATVRYWPFFSTLMIHQERRFNETGVLLTDPDFFRMFSFEFLQGDAATALAARDSLVMTESAARRYFGDNVAFGNTLQLPALGTDCRVVGIIKDPPPNSRLRFEIALRIEWLGEERLARWDEWMASAYVLLRPGSGPDSANRKMAAVFRKHIGNRQPGITTALQPLREVYLYQEGQAENLHRVYLFSGVALLILLVACVNFMNLGTLRAAQLAREVALRKVAGASRFLVAGQFLAESVLLAAMATLAALAGLYFLLPPVNEMTGQSLHLMEGGPSLPVYAAAVALVTGLLAGSYPALSLSASQPALTLRDKTANLPGGTALRKLLIVFQLSVSAGLVFCTLVIYRQIGLIENKDLGLDRKQIAVLASNPALLERFDAFKAELLRQPGILQVTGGSQLPTAVGNAVGIWADGASSDTRIGVRYLDADYDFFTVFGMKTVQGRFFDREHPADTIDCCLINESAASALGWTDPVGRHLVFDHPGVDPARRRLRVIGVVRDFHARSLHEPVGPFVFRMYRPWHSYVFVKMADRQTATAMAGIRKVFQAYVPEYPFSYDLMDDLYRRQYTAEIATGRLFNLFSLLAVLVASLGLYGLAAFTAEQMTREIGIRKVYGASVKDVLLLAGGRFWPLLAAANVIAWLAGYLLMRNWLDQFAYRIPLAAPLFLTATAVLLLVVALAAGPRLLRAARLQPAATLRAE